MDIIAVDIEQDEEDEILTPQEMRALEIEFVTAYKKWRAASDIVSYTQVTEAYKKLGKIESDKIRIVERWINCRNK